MQESVPIELLASDVLITLGKVVFQWLPATVSVLAGQHLEGETQIKQSEQMTPGSVSPDALAIAPTREVHPSTDFAGAHIDLFTLTAQAPSAFDAAVSQRAQALAPGVPEPLYDFWSSYVPFAIFVSLVLAMGIVYNAIRLAQVRKQEAEAWQSVAGPISMSPGAPTQVQTRWEQVKAHAFSNHPNDWRQAVMDADIMLDELLNILGYRGETMGDKMKQVERSDFNTIDLAWEAHKVRNQVAHGGSEFQVNEREVRRVISLYEQVFKEFEFI